jgi:hypothetical protein
MATAWVLLQQAAMPMQLLQMLPLMMQQAAKSRMLL